MLAIFGLPPYSDKPHAATFSELPQELVTRIAKYSMPYRVYGTHAATVITQTCFMVRPTAASMYGRPREAQLWAARACQVSSRWRYSFMPLVYEYPVIEECHHLGLLARTLCYAPQFIKRAVRGLATRLCAERAYIYVISIMGNAPRFNALLEVYNPRHAWGFIPSGTDEVWPDRAIELATLLRERSVEYVVWSSRVACLPDTAWIIQRLDGSRLRYIEITNIVNFRFYEDRRLPAIHLPACSSIRVPLNEGLFAYLERCKLPSLRKLSVTTRQIKWIGLHFGRFMETYGGYLEQFEVAQGSAGTERRVLQYRGEHGWFASVTPQLSDFICSLETMLHWSEAEPTLTWEHALVASHPNVRRIGVYFNRTQNDIELNPYIAKDAMSCLLSLLRYPNLKAVHVLDDVITMAASGRLGPRVRLFWKYAAMNCLAAGVRLQDVEGNLVDSTMFN